MPPCMGLERILRPRKKRFMRKTIQYAIKSAIPALMSYIPVGIAFGVLMKSAGFNGLWTGATSLFVYAGSLQFLMVDFLTSSTPLYTVAIMAFLLNSRHIFYGFTFLEKFRTYGKERYFLIHTLTDECFSLYCAYRPEKGLKEKTVFLWMSGFLYLCWIGSTIIGAFLGSIIPFDTTGMDFAMTGLFVVIVLSQIKEAPNLSPGLLALGSSLVCLLIFGADQFILPALIVTMGLLCLFRKKLEPAWVGKETPDSQEDTEKTMHRLEGYEGKEETL